MPQYLGKRNCHTNGFLEAGAVCLWVCLMVGVPIGMAGDLAGLPCGALFGAGMLVWEEGLLGSNCSGAFIISILRLKSYYYDEGVVAALQVSFLQRC